LATEEGPWSTDTVAWDYNNARMHSALRPQQIATRWWTNNHAWDALHRSEDGMLLQEQNTGTPPITSG